MKPSKEFTIKILSNEDFDNLPYPKAKESLGMSVMAEKTAYIRQTGVKEMDQGTISHEFDELMQTTSPHEENGIRYKAWIPWLISMAGAASRTYAVYSAGKGAYDAGMANTRKKQAESDQRKQWDAMRSSFSNATNAFAPQQGAGTGAPTPLGQEDFNTSLSNMTKNAGLRQKGVMDQFRGQTMEGNTAFNTASSNARTSSELERRNFLDDQRKLGSTFA